jgi:undecaprenyl-phosphate 4-deoxy-4-formamido-L-arabinose transferase
MTAPILSVIIPVYNEEQTLPLLFGRLYPALDSLNVNYEVLFVSDGSRDRSPAVLREQFQRRPDVTRVILFSANFGQHMAIMAGFEYCRGARVVTLDADLQNPPEEIGNLLVAMDAGHDYVGTIRRNRQDTVFRRCASQAMNWLRERITKIRMTDQGCMLRAYDRQIVDAIKVSCEVNTFIPALAYTYASSPIEIEVAHEERAAGESKYSIYSLLRLNFDLVTGFSIVPLQVFSLLGMFVALVSAVVYIGIIIQRWIAADTMREGVLALWDRDVLQFFLTGLVLFGLGLLGEYVGRMYQQVRSRPRYVVQAVLESDVDSFAARDLSSGRPAHDAARLVPQSK